MPPSSPGSSLWQELNRPSPDRATDPESSREVEPTASTAVAVAPPGPSGSRAFTALCLLLAAIVVIGGLSVFVGGRSEDPTLVDRADAAAPDTLALAEPTPTTVDLDLPATTDASVPPPSEGTVPPAPAGADEGTYAVLSGGRIFLRGTVPSVEIEQGIVAAVTQVMGEGNVVSEYRIDPATEFAMGRPVDVYIEDTVLFEFGSAEITPAFVPLLELGHRLLEIQPGVVLEVEGHTDAVGPDAANLALSQARVDAVRAFYLDRGVAPDRVVAIGRGESEPRASNESAEGRRLNRRVEFVVVGFTFGT